MADHADHTADGSSVQHDLGEKQDGSIKAQLDRLREGARSNVRDVVSRRERNKAERASIDVALVDALRIAIDAGVDRKVLAQDAGLSTSAISALVRGDKPKPKVEKKTK